MDKGMFRYHCNLGRVPHTPRGNRLSVVVCMDKGMFRYHCNLGRARAHHRAPQGDASKGLWTAKKRYILNVHDNEGVRYKTPELKIMGIEAVRSSTPAACREKLREIFKVIMNGDNEQLIEFINNMPESLKTAFTLRESEGKSYEEISLITETPIGTVRSRIFRARENILTFISEELLDE